VSSDDGAPSSAAEALYRAISYDDNPKYCDCRTKGPVYVMELGSEVLCAKCDRPREPSRLYLRRENE